ncbi:TPA: DUF3892 domain-containing protein [Legionella pneumophila]|uniref:DUF3892 domain-containing protein n=1 Tax=Legionella pneumophila TaxID=446 RepID=UPI0007707CD0|nr:DUF3892 domain-containing protein [Legionella pneumophila]TIG82098.1 DUF3892 domain-containing protein [Legionella pneumophila]CZG73853.1 Uncharacterised protein [Legionella pneumophila]STX82744.1 Uncharacterised protein [Legionella pneumophila]HAT2113131.1 DUF3892 domain-containing protein [Legionella pneumophila]HAT8720704.1 DUF3892 domain-containing protein [Legionella pneumophila]
MTKKAQVIVTQENTSGRNERFQDTSTGETMTRAQFVKKIEGGQYNGVYHVRTINGVKTPVSNPDKDSNNNLG